MSDPKVYRMHALRCAELAQAAKSRSVRELLFDLTQDLAQSGGRARTHAHLRDEAHALDHRPRGAGRPAATSSFLKTEFLAKIEPAHFRVVNDVVGTALQQHLARIVDVGAVGETERLAHIVV